MHIYIYIYILYAYILYIHVILYVCLNNIVKLYSCKDLSGTYDMRTFNSAVMI